MRILMVTNTFAPHVGGVARSVTSFTDEYRGRGHQVTVVAPVFPSMPEHEEDVIRVRAVNAGVKMHQSAGAKVHHG